MDITQILELDKVSRGRVKEANQTADRMQAETPGKINAIKAEILEKAKTQIEAEQTAQNQIAEKRIAEIHAKEQTQLAKLDDCYQQNGDHWVAQIVARVTGV